ncbi:unnamed protein product [Callosobruchus maculatus]|uniref:Uncharacterized protein n=1 Tax=Callosobruchus maculatus TaxID=64391 RepID=A0A653C873_CALMS|nr:unnamed protein product [Callosobruchus maculatus]
MSKQRVKGVKAYYDSEEGIAWGPYTAREMKDDLQRPRPKPKHRRTVYKIACKSPPSTSSSNDTMFTATSELEKENNSRICNIDDTNTKIAEGSSVTTYYSADNTNTKAAEASSMTTYYSTDNKTHTVTSKDDCNDSVITISSDEEEDGYEEQMSNRYGNMNSPVLIKKENESDEEVIILDDSTDEKFSNHTPDRLEEQMTELSLSEKPNDSGMVESQYYPGCDQKNIPAICLEDCETTLNDCGILKTRPVSERKDSGLKLHDSDICDNSNTMNQVEESDSSDGDTSFDIEASNHIEEITKAVESHSNNNSPHLPNLSCSNINNNYELRITRASDDSDIPDSDICHQAKAVSGNRLNLSSKESDATFAGSIHLDLSTDSSSVFDGSYFEGKEPWDAELDTTVEDDPCEPKQVPEKPAKLTPAKYETKKAKITPGKTTPQRYASSSSVQASCKEYSNYKIETDVYAPLSGETRQRSSGGETREETQRPRCQQAVTKIGNG